MRKRYLRAGFIVCMMAVPLLTTSCMLGADKPAATPAAAASSKPKGSNPSDYTVVVEKGNVSATLVGMGQIVPTRATSLYFHNVSGPLSKLNFTLNDKVEKGAVFAEILPSDLENRIIQQQIVVEKGEIRLAQLDEDSQIKDLEKTIELTQLDLVSLLKLQLNQSDMQDAAFQQAKLSLEQLQTQMSSYTMNKQSTEANKKLAMDQRVTEVQKLRIKLEQLDNDIISTKQSIAKEQSNIEKLAGILGDSALYETEYGNMVVDSGTGHFFHLPKHVADPIRNSKNKIEQFEIILSNNEKNKIMTQLDLEIALTRQNNPDYTVEQIDNSLANVQKSIEAAQLSINEVTRSSSVKMDQLLADIQKTKTRLEQLHLQLETAIKNKLRNRQQAELDLRSAKITLEMLQKNLRDSKLVAPVSGIVSFMDKKSVTDIVNGNQLFAKIADPSKLVFEMTSADAKYVTDVSHATLIIGTAKYEVETYKQQPGDQIDTSAKEMNNMSKVYVTFKGKAPDIKFGEIVQAQLEVAKQGALVIPKSDIRVERGKILVDVLKDKEVVGVEIIRGIETDTHVEVLGGLQPGDRIVHR